MEFKKEIEERFNKSQMNQKFKFPFMKLTDSSKHVRSTSSKNPSDVLRSINMNEKEPIEQVNAPEKTKKQLSTGVGPKIITTQNIENYQNYVNTPYHEEGQSQSVLNDFFNIQKATKQQITNR